MTAVEATANTRNRALTSKDMRPHPYADDWRKEKDLPFLARAMVRLGLLPPDPREVKVPQPTGKVPAYTAARQYSRLMPSILMPFFIRLGYYKYYGEAMNPWAEWGLLVTFLVCFNLWFVGHLNKLALRYGYFDPGMPRDTIPFGRVNKVMFEVIAGLTLRPALPCLLAYRPNQPPLLSLWLPVQLCIFTLVEDFYYYWLHRLCHDVNSAWQFHRLHHTTKHPTSLLLGYADELQECFDVVLVPMMAWFTYPLDFDTFMVWIAIHITIQIHGHCGVRLHYGTILTGPFLSALGLEIVSEDHDLHHRFGWQESCNYGKQSRFWDSLFGTCGERIEGTKDNVDWVNTV